MNNNNFNNKARYEQQPRVERESVNAVEELQSEETKKGMTEIIGDNKGMIAGGIVAAAAVVGIIVYRKKIWNAIKKPFTKKAAEATAEQPAEEPKKEADQK